MHMLKLNDRVPEENLPGTVCPEGMVRAFEVLMRMLGGTTRRSRTTPSMSKALVKATRSTIEGARGQRPWATRMSRAADAR